MISVRGCILAAVIAGGLFGCAPSAPIVGAGTGAAASAPLGADMGLAALLEHARATGAAVRQASAELSAADAAIGGAKGALGPRAELSADAIAIGSLDSAATLAVHQPLWAGGRLRGNVALKEMARAMAAARLSAAQDSAAHTVTDLYFDWALAHRSLLAQQDAAAAAQDILQTVQDGFDAGALSSADLTSAQLQASRFSRSALLREGQREAALAQLETYLSTPLDPIALAQAIPQSIPNRAKIKTGAQDAAALAARTPAVLAATLEAQLKTIELAQARRSGLPQLEMTGKVALAPTGAQGQLEREQGVGLGLRFDLNNPLAQKSKIAEAASAADAQVARIDLIRQEQLTRIVQSGRIAGDSGRRIAALAQSQDAARSALASSRRQGDAGSADWKTQFSALQEQTDITIALTEAQLQQMAAVQHLAIFAGPAQ